MYYMACVKSKICIDYSSWIIYLEERLSILIITTVYVYQNDDIVKTDFSVCRTESGPKEFTSGRM